MSDNSKRQKGKKTKNMEPKDQRKPRESRHQERKVDHHVKGAEKPVAQTDILNISEGSNAKYNKKEIQSNWGKYETELPSYERCVDEEDLGGDFEKLIQTGSSTGGHFQFKHEKSWNSNTDPTDYDRYFDIDPNMLSMALGSIAFYHRNSISESLFNPSDISAMNDRALKYKTTYKARVAEKNKKSTKVDQKNDSGNLYSQIAEDVASAKDIESYLPKSPLPSLEQSNETGADADVDDQIVPEANTKRDMANVAEIDSLTSPTPAVQSPEELEKWLDDFLDT